MEVALSVFADVSKANTSPVNEILPDADPSITTNWSNVGVGDDFDVDNPFAKKVFANPIPSFEFVRRTVFLPSNGLSWFILIVGSRWGNWVNTMISSNTLAIPTYWIAEEVVNAAPTIDIVFPTPAAKTPDTSLTRACVVTPATALKESNKTPDALPSVAGFWKETTDPADWELRAGGVGFPSASVPPVKVKRTTACLEE